MGGFSPVTCLVDQLATISRRCRRCRRRRGQARPQLCTRAPRPAGICGISPVSRPRLLAAEDRTFFEHGGIDYPGIATAILTNLKRDGRLVGAWSNYVQVVKNPAADGRGLYLHYEAILAKRIEAALTACW